MSDQLTGSNRAQQSSGGSVAGGRASLWEVFARQVQDSGATLFDMEVPSSRYGTIRVFITRTPGGASLSPAAPQETSPQESCSQAGGAQQGVTLELCARVSKQLSAFMESPEGAELGLAGEDWALEVSSPGINRSLRRPEHFAGACGERVRVRFSKSETVSILPLSGASPELAQAEASRIKGKGVIVGKLIAVQDNALTLVDDSGLVEGRIPLRECRDARVDFLF